MVGEHCLGVRLLNVGMIDTNVGSDEDEVYLLALQGRNVAEIMVCVSGACMIGRHMIGIQEFKI